MRGTMIWFNSQKGYGFIRPIGAGEMADIFVHHTAIQMDGYRELKANQTVEFDLKPSDWNGRPLAVNVVVVAGGQK
jgi:cold shock protein